MKAIAVLVAFLSVAVAAPASSISAARPTGTGAPTHEGHDHPGLPFPAFQGGPNSFSGDHSFTRTGTRPAHTHTGAPHSFTGSGRYPRPTHSMIRGDQRPGGWPNPSQGVPQSFSGVPPSFTQSFPAPSQSA